MTTSTTTLWRLLPLGLLALGLGVSAPAFARENASEPASADTPDAENAVPSVDLLEGMRSGELAVKAEGSGSDRMTLTVKNRTHHQLQVILPPGLIASGATGQFGGMGGMGGGMGGMGGGMMGGMGGMGGGMGGMGGGMGGMGGMRGGMGGMRGGRGGGMSGTMPPMMGMMMLAGVIVRLTGDLDSWDFMSQRLSYMAGFMGGRMGGMGGGMMGGMGGGMMGGMGGMGGMMGGGFRSIPPTGVPVTTLHPDQTRRLPANLVSLRGPTPDGRVNFPRKGEPLRLSGIERVTGDTWSRAALRKLAEEKAPQTLAQLVLWNVVDGFEWDTIAKFSRGWSNPNELTLARAFVDRLVESEGRVIEKSEGAVLRYELTSRREAGDPLLADLRKLIDGTTMLGLKAVDGIPATPESPCLACRLRLDDEILQVQLSVSSSAGTSWDSVGKFSINLKNEQGIERSAIEILDQLSEKSLGRLIDTRLVSKSVHGKRKYSIQIKNVTPLVLNALALSGPNQEATEPPSLLLGLSLTPHRTLTVPASEDAVDRLGLAEGIRPIAAELDGL